MLLGIERSARSIESRMEPGRRSFQLLYLLVLMILPSEPHLSEARTITVVNDCTYTVWPGTLSNTGQLSLARGGFVLAPGARQEITAPVGWAGRFWGRTGCTFDVTDAGTCQTGDCGRGLYCDGAGGIPPATLAEFTLDGYGALDFYDVSLVDGYNVPLGIVQVGGTGKCGNPGCVSDLNLICPAILQVVINGTVVSCRSACEAFRTDMYCCSGVYNSPQTCLPTEYSLTFKQACPTAYSYAYDDGSSTYTCTGGAFEIVFCPSGTSIGNPPLPSPPPSTNGSYSPPPYTIAPPGQVPPPPPSSTLAPPPQPSWTIPPPTAYSPFGSTLPPPPPLTTTFDSPLTAAAPTRSRVSRQQLRSLLLLTPVVMYSMTLAT